MLAHMALIPGTNGTPKVRIAVVGTAKDCATSLAADVERIARSLSPLGSLTWLIIESDSVDGTRTVLENLKTQLDDFEYIALGKLADERTVRTDRIAHCRNHYLDAIISQRRFQDIDYVIVSDFDGLNTDICFSNVASCWERSDWDACFANQRGRYYDVFALRHEFLCPNDCWAHYEFLRPYEKDPYVRARNAVYSRMINIPEDSDWIEVDSAFGGFAIYKRDCFVTGRYDGLSSDGGEVCEHVAFNRKLKQSGAKLYINPKLINAKQTEHTIYLNRLNVLKMSIEGFLQRLFKYEDHIRKIGRD